MAEITNLNKGHKNGNFLNERSRRATRVDLTPMVDLGFLLITFFVFTTSASQPSSMNLVMPKDSIDSMLIKKTGTLILLPADNNRVYYYYGDDSELMRITNYQALRNIVLDKKKDTKAEEFFVIIKPYKNATYKNAVNVLDEMIINDVSRYAITDPDANEYLVVERMTTKY